MLHTGALVALDIWQIEAVYFQQFGSKFKRLCKGLCMNRTNFPGWMDPCHYRNLDNDLRW